MEQPKVTDIKCLGYTVKADVYDAGSDGPILLSLIGRTSSRMKQHYHDLLPRLANELDITTVIFDYTGHGDSPFAIEDTSPAQHFLEVITVFDWMKERYPNRRVFVVGSSYGGFLATQLIKYREFDALILRAPAMYRPEDFYTLQKNENKQVTLAFRKDTAALLGHPLLRRAAEFKGKILLVVHENDEIVPKETTDAYAEALKPEIFVVAGITHSLDGATKPQVAEYNQRIYDWLKLR
jgi:pimeloyl-ACP methyl ester carboxylesterase